MKTGSERFIEHVERNYAKDLRPGESMKPYKPPKVLMEQYQRAHEYHELPSLDVDKDRVSA